MSFYLLNPNCFSRRKPMRTTLNILTMRWTTPAWSHIDVTSLHFSLPFTTLLRSKAPIFSNLKPQWGLESSDRPISNNMESLLQSSSVKGSRNREKDYVEEDGPKRGFSLRGWNENLRRNLGTQSPLAPATVLGQSLMNMTTMKTAIQAKTMTGVSHAVHWVLFPPFLLLGMVSSLYVQKNKTQSFIKIKRSTDIETGKINDQRFRQKKSLTLNSLFSEFWKKKRIKPLNSI